MQFEGVGGGRRVTATSSQREGHSPRGRVSPKPHCHGPSSGKATCFSVPVLLLLRATHGNLRGYSVEFKVILKQTDPLDPESIAFLWLGFLPLHLRRALCLGPDGVQGGGASFSTQTVPLLASPSSVPCAPGPPDGKWDTRNRAGDRASPDRVSRRLLGDKNPHAAVGQRIHNTDRHPRSLKTKNKTHSVSRNREGKRQPVNGISGSRGERFYWAWGKPPPTRSLTAAWRDGHRCSVRSQVKKPDG